MRIVFILFSLLRFCSIMGYTQQVALTVAPNQLLAPVDENYTPGTFFVPKTNIAFSDFMNNGIQQSAIRTNVIESALNNAANLTQCLALLNGVQNDLQALSAKTQRLIFIFEKMPPWLSSSSDPSPAQTPGWSVLNTKAPASWIAWQTAVDSITAVIVNQMGINNAWFEVWNEPDIGSWTSTQNDYWMLYKTTYDGVKSASSSAKVGGPAVNGWANNIGWQPAYGYVDNITGDSSIIGQLLDSSVVWNRVPDFISWHNFSMNYLEHYNAVQFITQKLTSLSIGSLPLIVSEWNAPSAVRDAPLATSYTARVPMLLELVPVTCNIIAAWQDFSPSTNEFHNDYGLITYGAIHKPAYYSSLLAEKLGGTGCVFSTSEPADVKCTVITDTVYCLITNYCPPPFFEAVNYSLYYGMSNINAYDSAGYINLQNADFSYLDSIFRGLIPFTPTNTMENGISQAIPVYQHYDSIDNTSRTFQVALTGFAGNYSVRKYVIDSVQNNMQYKYDSLLNAGFTQSAAIAYILPIQGLRSASDTMIGGTVQIALQPNAVCLVKIAVPGVSNIQEIELTSEYNVSPNPTHNNICVSWNTTSSAVEQIVIYDVTGRIVFDAFIKSGDVIEVGSWDSGVYYVRRKNEVGRAAQFVKH